FRRVLFRLGTYENLPEVSAREVAILLAQAGPSTPRNLELREGVDEPLRLIDSKLRAHPARIHVPRGLGPAPAVILVGLSQGLDALLLRLAEAGIASLRLESGGEPDERLEDALDRKSTRLNSSHVKISYAVFCLK